MNDDSRHHLPYNLNIRIWHDIYYKLYHQFIDLICSKFPMRPCDMEGSSSFFNKNTLGNLQLNKVK